MEVPLYEIRGSCICTVVFVQFYCTLVRFLWYTVSIHVCVVCTSVHPCVVLFLLSVYLPEVSTGVVGS